MQKDDGNDYAITIIEGVNSNNIIIWPVVGLWWFCDFRFYLNFDHWVLAYPPTQPDLTARIWPLNNKKPYV